MTTLRKAVLTAGAAAVVTSLALGATACGGQRRGGAAGPGSARPAPSAAPSGTRTGAAPATVVADLTWISPTAGWALAGVPCGRNTCAAVAHTSDGGRTWTWRPAPQAYLLGSPDLGYARPLVSHIRFVTASVGYLYGPDLFSTRDGGRTWVRQPGHPVVQALEPDAGAVIRVRYAQQAWRIQLAAGRVNSWGTVLTVYPVTRDPVRAQIAWQSSQAVFVIIYGSPAAGAAGPGRATILRSTDGGRSWASLRDPCGGASGAGPAQDLATAPGGFVAVLCAAGRTQRVLTSADDGASWTPAQSPGRGSAAVLATPGGPRIVLAGRAGLLVSADGGRHWQLAVRQTARESAQNNGSYQAFLGFENQHVGRWVEYPRTIWETRDGGARWTAYPFPAESPAASTSTVSRLTSDSSRYGA